MAFDLSSLLSSYGQPSYGNSYAQQAPQQDPYGFGSIFSSLGGLLNGLGSLYPSQGQGYQSYLQDPGSAYGMANSMYSPQQQSPYQMPPLQTPSFQSYQPQSYGTGFQSGLDPTMSGQLSTLMNNLYGQANQGISQDPYSNGYNTSVSSNLPSVNEIYRPPAGSGSTFLNISQQANPTMMDAFNPSFAPTNTYSPTNSNTNTATAYGGNGSASASSSGSGSSYDPSQNPYSPMNQANRGLSLPGYTGGTGLGPTIGQPSPGYAATDPYSPPSQSGSDPYSGQPSSPPESSSSQPSQPTTPTSLDPPPEKSMGVYSGPSGPSTWQTYNEGMAGQTPNPYSGASGYSASNPYQASYNASQPSYGSQGPQGLAQQMPQPQGYQTPSQGQPQSYQPQYAQPSQTQSYGQPSYGQQPYSQPSYQGSQPSYAQPSYQSPQGYGQQPSYMQQPQGYPQTQPYNAGGYQALQGYQQPSYGAQNPTSYNPGALAGMLGNLGAGSYGQPSYGQGSNPYSQPPQSYGQPYQQPQYGQPSYNQPSYQQPYGQPMSRPPQQIYTGQDQGGQGYQQPQQSDGQQPAQPSQPGSNDFQKPPDPVAGVSQQSQQQGPQSQQQASGTGGLSERMSFSRSAHRGQMAGPSQPWYQQPQPPSNWNAPGNGTTGSAGNSLPQNQQPHAGYQPGGQTNSGYGTSLGSSINDPASQGGAQQAPTPPPSPVQQPQQSAPPAQQPAQNQYPGMQTATFGRPSSQGNLGFRRPSAGSQGSQGFQAPPPINMGGNSQGGSGRQSVQNSQGWVGTSSGYPSGQQPQWSGGPTQGWTWGTPPTPARPPTPPSSRPTIDPLHGQVGMMAQRPPQGQNRGLAGMMPRPQ